MNRQRARLEAEESAVRSEVFAHFDQAVGMIFDEIDDIKRRLDENERRRR